MSEVSTIGLDIADRGTVTAPNARYVTINGKTAIKGLQVTTQ
jgi:hypothetical protein